MILHKKLGYTFVSLVFLCSSLHAEFRVKSFQEFRNEKVVRQNYEESCGAASLATLLNMLGLKQYTEIDLLKLMNEKQFHTDMVSFADLMSVLDRLDYKNNAYQIDRQSLNKLFNIPILVKIEDDPRFPHFVVIINHEGDFLQVFDPSLGAYISSKRQFFSIWDKQNRGGFTLIVLPKGKFPKNKMNLPDKIHFEFKPFQSF